MRPHAPVAERVLLPGDPGRALRLAQLLIDGPKMLNHNRGLWGYSGPAADGQLLTIQATGMGGPSAAIVTEELIALGARRLVRVGTCGALTAGLPLGGLVVADAALPFDGASKALGADAPVEPDEVLHRALRACAGADAAVGPVASVDLFYDPDDTAADGWRAAGAIAVEMEAAALLAVARRRGVAAAVLLTVSDVLSGGGRRRIGDEELLEAEARLGRAAAAAVGAN